MKILLLVAGALIAGAMPVSCETANKPNFNGTWVLQTNGSPQIYTYEHDATQFHMIQRIEDPNDKRTIDVTCQIDGQPHLLNVDGDKFVITVAWFGDSLTYETRRERPTGITRNRRIMTLSGADEIHVLRTRFLPGPERTWEETWLRKSEK